MLILHCNYKQEIIGTNYVILEKKVVPNFVNPRTQNKANNSHFSSQFSQFPLKSKTTRAECRQQRN